MATLINPIPLAVLVLIIDLAHAQQDWRPDFPVVEPGARTGARMTFDAARGEIVLFGGVNAPNPASADTWTWNGSSWTQRSSARAPSGRHLHELCYDSTRQRVVLYGGLGSGGAYGDTWEWDGTSWRQITPAASPPARANTALAYDGTRTLLFGGGNSATPRNDLWRYDGTTWVQLATANAPSPRYYHSMASNGTGELLMFGGFDPTVGYSGETWRFNGTNWSLVSSPTAPSARGSAVLVWDGSRYLLWGGSDSFFSTLEDTWAFSGGQWTQLTTARSPSSRGRAAGAWFTPSQRLVTYGGEFLQAQHLRNDLMWEFGTGLASFVRWGPTVCPALDPPWLVGVSQPALGAQFQVRVGSFAAVDNFLFAGFSTTQWQSFALPFDLAAFGTWPNCWLRVSTDLTLHLGFGQTATWSLAIPNTTSLLGAQLHLQGITIGQGSFPTNVSLSNAGTIVVGAL